MADDIEVKVDEQKVVEEPTYSPVETEQMELGWLPKDKWVEAGKPEDEWRPAKDFKERGELFSRIASLDKENRATKATLKALKGHYDQVRETEYQNALKTLKQEKKAALEAGDADAVIDIDEKIQDTKAQQRQEKAEAQRQEVAQVIPPEFNSWTQSNPWYGKNQEMTVLADNLGKSYALQNPGVSPKEVLDYVTSRVKKAFPESFTNPRRESPGAVESPRTTAKAAKVDFEMDDIEKAAMEKFVKMKIMTKEQYIEDLKKVKGIK